MDLVHILQERVRGHDSDVLGTEHPAGEVAEVLVIPIERARPRETAGIGGRHRVPIKLLEQIGAALVDDTSTYAELIEMRMSTRTTRAVAASELPRSGRKVTVAYVPGTVTARGWRAADFTDARARSLPAWSG